MKSTVSLLSLLVSSAVWSAQTVNQDLDADAKAQIEIDVVRGEFSITGWDKNVVHVEGKLDERSEAFIFEKRGDSILIKDKVPNNLGRGEGTKLTIFIPRGGSVDAEGVSTNITLKEVAGRVELTSVSGNITAEKASHDVQIETVSGDVQLRGAGKEVTLQTISGDINAYVTSSRLSAESISGNIQLRNEGVLDRGDYSTISGDVRIESALSETADIELESVSGTLVLTVRGEVNARINAETGPGGNIHNELTADEPDEAEFTGAESLEIKAGNGKGRIDASVVSGDIEFRKK